MTKNQPLNKKFEKEDGVPALQGADEQFFSTAWELACGFERLGRKKEAVDYFLLSAAILEKCGNSPEQIYRKILSIDSNNSLADSRLKNDGQNDRRRKVFISHILSRHSHKDTLAALEDERRRGWVTPPREEQRTCPECGMGVPQERNSCGMCGFSLEACYRKRTTAAYGLMTQTQESAKTPQTDPNTTVHSNKKESEKFGKEGHDAPLSTGKYHHGFSPSSRAHTGRSEPVAVQTKPRVILLSSDGSDKVIAASEKQEVTIGSHPDCFGHKEESSHTEEKHAKVFWGGNGFHVIDLGSRAGVYLRVQESQVCKSPRLIQIGSQTLVVSGRSSHRSGFRIGHLDNSGGELCVVETPDTSMTVGRTESTLSFPQDPFLSAPHAKISWHNAEQQSAPSDSMEIFDLSQKWGTYVKLPQETDLPNGSVIKIGRLLFRLELD